MYLLSKCSIYEKIVCTDHTSTSVTKLATRILLLIRSIAYVDYLPYFPLHLSVKMMVVLLLSVSTYRDSNGRI